MHPEGGMPQCEAMAPPTTREGGPSCTPLRGAGHLCHLLAATKDAAGGRSRLLGHGEAEEPVGADGGLTVLSEDCGGRQPKVLSPVWDTEAPRWPFKHVTARLRGNQGTAAATDRRGSRAQGIRPAGAPGPRPVEGPLAPRPAPGHISGERTGSGVPPRLGKREKSRAPGFVTEQPPPRSVQTMLTNSFPTAEQRLRIQMGLVTFAVTTQQAPSWTNNNRLATDTPEDERVTAADRPVSDGEASGSTACGGGGGRGAVTGEESCCLAKSNDLPKHKRPPPTLLSAAVWGAPANPPASRTLTPLASSAPRPTLSNATARGTGRPEPLAQGGRVQGPSGARGRRGLPTGALARPALPATRPAAGTRNETLEKPAARSPPPSTGTQPGPRGPAGAHAGPRAACPALPQRPA